MRRFGINLLLLSALLTIPAIALAQPAATDTKAQIVALQQAVDANKAAAASAQSAGDNAWMLTSAALVLLMTGPGLALFYGGLVRKKNVLGTMMQSFAMMGLVTILWAIVGYSLAFGHGNWFIGGFEHLFLKNVPLAADPSNFYSATIPEQTYMIYQLMFAIITPALISGAYAERMKFSAMVLFTTLWAFIVYFPMAHMVWGKGGFLNAYLGGTVRTFDFAGGTVVHITSGVSALICALYLGKRVGYPQESMKPHSLVLSVIGACLLWVGWFGFNAGSAVAASGLATSAFVATHMATAAAALSWMVAEWLGMGKPSMLGGISGAVAGLVAITPASGFVKPMPALVIGAIAGVVCFLMVTAVKKVFGYDDTLDAFGVHGVGGTVGALLTGVFATNLVNDTQIDGKVIPLGLVDGNPGQILNQAIAVLIAIGLAVVGTFVILKICDALIGVRVDPVAEEEGLDLSQHGEEGYFLEA